MTNYKGIMISEYAKTIEKLNPIINIHEQNIHQNIKLFPNWIKSIDINDKSDYFYNDKRFSIDSKNDDIENLKKYLNVNGKLLDKSLLYKRTRLYSLKNFYQYPFKNFPGSLSEFSITQDKNNFILFGGQNSGINPNVWKFNSSDRSWEIIKDKGIKVYSRYGHTTVL